MGSRRINLSGALWCCQQLDPMATGSCHRIWTEWNCRIGMGPTVLLKLDAMSRYSVLGVRL